MITGGSSLDFKKQATEKESLPKGEPRLYHWPSSPAKWPHVPLTFDARDIDLHSAPHADTLVINYNVAGWDLHKVFVDNDSQADNIFLHAFDHMGINQSLLQPADNPLYGSRGKGAFPLGKI
jgi:hypothetical protein